MNKKNIKTGQMHLRAAPIPNSYDSDARTIDVTFGSETPVTRFDWFEEERYNEVLSFAEGEANLSRMNQGSAPVLYNHKSDMIIGTVESARVDGDMGVATIRLSSAKDVENIVTKIEEGVLRSLSIGYKVNTYEETRIEGEIPLRRAIDWEAYEISFVTIPADATASVRSKRTKEFNTIILTGGKEEQPDPSKFESEMKDENKRKEQEEGVEMPDFDALSKEARESERKRIQSIDSALRTAGLEDNELRTELIDSDLSYEKAAKRIFEAMENKQPETPKRGKTIEIGQSDQDKIRDAAEAALLHKIGSKQVKLEGEAREMAGLRLTDFGRYLGEKVTGQRMFGKTSDMEIATDMLGLGQRTLSTSDYPSILRNVADKRLIELYEQFPETWSNFCQSRTTSDFKAIFGERLDSNTRFDKMQEGGTYSEMKFQETEETVRTETYGKSVSMTRQLIINDDLGAFDRRLLALAEGAARTKGDIIWGLLLNNTNYQGSAVFSAARNNYIASGSGSQLSIASLGEARARMMKQENSAGDRIMVRPAFVVVAPDQLTLAEQVLNSNTDIANANEGTINPFANRLQILVEQRLDQGNYTLGNTNGLAWLAIAAPGLGVENILTTSLDGGELYTESRVRFENDALEVKARFDFGAAIWDYRGFQFNFGE